MPRKTVEFIFGFPPIKGLFYTQNGTIYIFGEELDESEIEEIIDHEALHYAIRKVAGTRASIRLDRVEKTNDRALLSC